MKTIRSIIVVMALVAGALLASGAFGQQSAEPPSAAPSAVTPDAGGNLGGLEMKGTIRDVNTEGHTLEIVPMHPNATYAIEGTDVVVVKYDAETAILAKGEPYPAENLKAGDVVTIRFRDIDGDLLAKRIVVGEENPPANP